MQTTMPKKHPDTGQSARAATGHKPADHPVHSAHDVFGNQGMQRLVGAPRGATPIAASVTPGTLQRSCGCDSSAGCECDQKGPALPWLQRQAGPGGGTPSGGAAAAALRGLGSGRPLDSASRSFMQPRFGRDFSGVRIHTDAAAGHAARTLNAEAFTIGGDIHFAEGKYRPDTAPGRRLLAHELTHTVQQGGRGGAVARSVSGISEPHDASEREAASVAERVHAQPVLPADQRKADDSRAAPSHPVVTNITPAGAIIQRQDDSGASAQPPMRTDPATAVPGSVTIDFLTMAPWYAVARDNASPVAIAVELYGLEVPSLVQQVPITGALAVQPNLLRPGYRARFDTLLEARFQADVQRVEDVLFDSAGPFRWPELLQTVRDWSRLHDVARNGGANWFDAFLGRLDSDYTYIDYGVTTGSRTSYLASLFAAGGDNVGALFALVSQNSERFGLYRPPDALLRDPKSAGAGVNPALVKRASDLVLQRLEGVTTAGDSGAITAILTGMPPAGQAAVLQEIMSRYNETDWTGLLGRYGERRPVGMLWWLFEDLTKGNRRTLADSLVAKGVLRKDAADALVEGRGFVAQFLPYTTDMAVDATQYWADQYEKSSGAEAALYGVMGGLSVLATPRVIDQTALILGTAGVGAELGPVLAARAPTLAAGLTLAGTGFAGYQAGAAIGRLIDGRDAKGRPLDTSGRAALALLAFSNILLGAATVLSLAAPAPAAETGIVRTLPGEVTSPAPAAGAGQAGGRTLVNMRLVSFDPESGEMIVAAQDVQTGRYALGRMNVQTGSGQFLGPEGQVVQIENFQAAPTRPALPAAGETQVPGAIAPARGLVQAPGSAEAPALPPGAKGTAPALPPGPGPTLQLPPGPRAPLLLPGARYHTLAEILPDPAGAFVVPDIERAYQTYVRTQPSDVPATREEWVRLTRKGPRAELVRWLGPNFPTAEGEPVYIRLGGIARPASLTDARLTDLVAQLEADPTALRARYDPASAAGPGPGEVNLGNFNALKGNVGEILALPIRRAIVANIVTRFPGAQVYDGVRMRTLEVDGTPGPALLFSDGVVAETIGNRLVIRGVVETKSGSTGGQQGTEQMFETNELRIQPGAQLVLPDGRSFTYDPDNSIRNPDGSAPPKVIFLLSAGRSLIAAAGTEALGEGSSMGIGPKVGRYALPANPQEINFVTRLMAERLAAPATPALTSPAPTGTTPP
jgi:hypothetical protein